MNAAERNVFLHDVPLEAARARFADALAQAGVRNDAIETLALGDALDRVTARPVAARLSSPHYHACAMDGIAVVAARTAGALETAPLELSAEEAPVVDTGDPLPDGFDAVIPIELIEPRANGRVAIRAAVAPFGAGTTNVTVLDRPRMTETLKITQLIHDTKKAHPFSDGRAWR